MDRASEDGKWNGNGHDIDGEWDERSDVVDPVEGVEEKVVRDIAQEGQPGQVNICS